MKVGCNIPVSRNILTAFCLCEIQNVSGVADAMVGSYGVETLAANGITAVRSTLAFVNV